MTEIISIKQIVDVDTGLHMMHTEVLEDGKPRVIVEIIERWVEEGSTPKSLLE